MSKEIKFNIPTATDAQRAVSSTGNFLRRHKKPLAIGAAAALSLGLLPRAFTTAHNAWADSLPAIGQVKPGSYLCLPDDAIFRSGPDPDRKDESGYPVDATLELAPGKGTGDMVCTQLPTGADFVKPENPANPSYLRLTPEQISNMLTRVDEDLDTFSPAKRTTKSGAGTPADMNSIQALSNTLHALQSKERVSFTPSARIVEPGKSFPQK